MPGVSPQPLPQPKLQPKLQPNPLPTPKDSMTNPLKRLLQDATRLTQTGRLADATQALQRGLAGRLGAGLGGLGGVGGGPAGHVTSKVAAVLRSALAGLASPARAPAAGTVIDGCVTEVVPQPRSATDEATASDASHPTDTGQFTSRSHSHGGLTRAYKLYAPPGAAVGNTARPLLVMLHGCTQDPDDFAAGTGMNALARQHGVWVLYPAQAADANPQRCWNWFKHNHQQRGRGEAGWIANLTQTLLAQHQVDPARVWIAGLSAGGAMAASVAAAYPELYAAVGVHSGLAAGAANGLPQALQAMRSGAASAPATANVAIPTIVFHGAQDSTVNPRNGEQVISSVPQAGLPSATTEQGQAAGGRRYTRRSQARADGRPLTEHWLVHGAGHAWSGGQPAGSYTDAGGPDASAEMLRFFLAQAPQARS